MLFLYLAAVATSSRKIMPRHINQKLQESSRKNMVLMFCNGHPTALTLAPLRIYGESLITESEQDAPDQIL
ncbi:hypothetical protein PHYBLDRAFT_127613 [Phycomyces blakesleeanus NRRL 1555(-)]|uniref:Uncharacterized protein n=1 Tax=Phycomyces blakesleeanus (strain ATCC 8743b / DSM 1359 / FGSC 10004 / NBRC 33097 / NRRL 1555) TaxID=763407 RepID=A0A167KKG5_PHYB8|nr:hypothetical protein PHYBLDRAFT_127613 [Phycomyces blakesleeanus NRRL 1555(-)]OAD68297.1 hypothetical protein PHYBLDRAFT_127613 [Phycomyces blakesleeanus NRRL 1555(-)]|eukprot:XP_018286337.1 hypothetical protein PHYBLDRAFT_127613 [Phycomyces blakesleeanus NRRL 1555(-)]